MRKLGLLIAGSVLVLGMAAPAAAHDPRQRHDSDHDQLEQRHDATHDALEDEHAAAHEEGMNWREHRELHRELQWQHDRADRRLERQHRRQHRNYDGYNGHNGYGY